jgi:hypothetical protein
MIESEFWAAFGEHSRTKMIYSTGTPITDRITMTHDDYAEGRKAGIEACIEKIKSMYKCEGSCGWCNHVADIIYELKKAID